MSKTLSKVLVICALVAVLPLMIVGTALAAYYSVDNVVNIATIYVDGLKSSVENAYITYNGKNAENFEIKEGHTKSVEVIAGETPAYIFKGWYAGNADEYANGTAVFAQNDAKLNISMETSKNYVAVYEVVKYTISWNYLTNPADSSTATTLAPSEKSTFIYGESLPTLTYSGADYKFAGWKVGGDTTGVRYSAANFASDRVTLVDPWIESDKITVTFNYGAKKVAKEIVAGEPWTIPAISDPLFAELGIETKAGYTYCWIDAEGSKPTVVSNLADLELYLAEPEAISYTATLTYDANELAEGETVGNVNFTVENYSDFANWLNLETKYSFWEVGGIKYNGTTYTSATLENMAKAYAENCATTTTFELVINKKFTTLTVEKEITFLSARKEEHVVYELPIYVGNDYGVNEYKLSSNTSSNSVETETLYEFFDIKVGETEYPVYTAIEENGSPVKWVVDLREIKVTMNGQTFNVNSVSKNNTLVEFISKCVTKYEASYGKLTVTDILTITSMEAHFYPVERADFVSE